MKYKNLIIIAVLLVSFGCATTGSQVAVTNEPMTEQEREEAYTNWKNRQIAFNVLEYLTWGAIGAISFDYFLRHWPF